MIVGVQEERRVGSMRDVIVPQASQINVDERVAVKNKKAFGHSRQCIAQSPGRAPRDRLDLVTQADAKLSAVTKILRNDLVSMVHQKRYINKAMFAAQLELVLQQWFSKYRGHR